MAEDQEKRIREQSMFSHLKSWRLLRMIVKSNDDLRSEQFAMQIIETIDLIWKKRHLKLKVKPYEILSTELNCGIVEFLPDAYSIDYIKRKIKQKRIAKGEKVSSSSEEEKEISGAEMMLQSAWIGGEPTRFTTPAVKKKTIVKKKQTVV